MADEQDCRQCGKCCEKWGWDQKGIVADLDPWLRNNRKDILQHVSIRLINGRTISGRDLTPADLPHIARIYYWITPEGKKRYSCPFFFRADDDKVYCRIHMMKPAVCIGFRPWAEVYHDYGLNCPACRDIAP